MEEPSDVWSREVIWRTRLQPFSYVLVFVWTALSFQQSHTAGFAVYAAAFTVLLGFTLINGSLVYHLGLLLLLTALSYGLLAVGVRSQSLGFRGTLAFDESAVLRTICTHLALLDRLVLAGLNELTSLRSQQPMWFYVSGMVVVFITGRLGQWLSFIALLWMAGVMILLLPTALSRGWVSVPTSKAVKGTLHGIAVSLQAPLSSLGLSRT